VLSFGEGLQCCCLCMKRCVAVCCSVLQRVAACCNVLQCVAVCCSVLQCMCCNALQCIFSSVLQCVAVCCSSALRLGTSSCSAAILLLTYCNILQHTATLLKATRSGERIKRFFFSIKEMCITRKETYQRDLSQSLLVLSLGLWDKMSLALCLSAQNELCHALM